jgi:formylmethanofuran dehydrogenase subunit E
VSNLKKVQDWMREPDYAKEFRLPELIDWINRRHLAELASLVEVRPCGHIPMKAALDGKIGCIKCGEWLGDAQ